MLFCNERASFLKSKTSSRLVACLTTQHIDTVSNESHHFSASKKNAISSLIHTFIACYAG